MLCINLPIYEYIIGIIICIGSIISYIPQYYTLIKTKSSVGLSEFSIILSNMSFFLLSYDSIISNFYRLQCFKTCHMLFCMGYMMSFIQLLLGWILVSILYILYLKYKIRESRTSTIYNFIYVIIYGICILIITIISLISLYHMNDYIKMFNILTKIVGIFAGICTFLLWVPQIYLLIRKREIGSLNIYMFLIQIPGNIITIMFQILYKSNWTIWLSYIISVIEQFTVVFLIISILKSGKIKPQYILLQEEM